MASLSQVLTIKHKAIRLVLLAAMFLAVASLSACLPKLGNSPNAPVGGEFVKGGVARGFPNLPFYNLGNLNIFVWPPSINFILLSYIAVILFGAGIGLVGNYLSTTKYIK